MTAAGLVAVNIVAFGFVAWFAWWRGARARRPIHQVVPMSDLMGERSALWTLREIASRGCQFSSEGAPCPKAGIERAQWCAGCIAEQALNPDEVQR